MEIIVLGGTAMLLGFQARASTKDVDYAPLDVGHPAKLRTWAAQVAMERGWEPTWLNDGAKGYLHGQVTLTRVYHNPGLRVYIPSVPQLLAMKLAAWRDDIDIADAMLLLGRLGVPTIESAWQQVAPFVIPGGELKTRYALEDLWHDRSSTHPDAGASGGAG